MTLSPTAALVERWIYPMVKAGPEFLVPLGEPTLARIREEGGYDPPFFPFLDRFLEALAAPGWAAGSYFPGGWYRALRARGKEPLAAEPSPDALGPFYGEELVVDRLGRWRLGSRPIEGRVLAFFLRHLHHDAALGRYYVRYRLETIFERRYLHHEGPPYRVVAIDTASDPPRTLLNDGSWEPLALDALWLDRDEELHCPVKAQRLPARFAGTARWEILRSLEEREGRLVVRIGGREAILAPPPPG